MLPVEMQNFNPYKMVVSASPLTMPRIVNVGENILEEEKRNKGENKDGSNEVDLIVVENNELRLLLTNSRQQITKLEEEISILKRSPLYQEAGSVYKLHLIKEKLPATIDPRD